MEQTSLITTLRQETGDQEQPYKYDDPALLGYIQGAVSDYSRYRPRHRKGTVILQPNILEYPLPDDFQTWTTGLENYEVIEKTLYLENPPASSLTIKFNYLGDHDIASVPNNHLPIIVDYCMWKLLSDAVREGSEISELKLGKGLDIKFDNFDQINKLAEMRHSSYLDAVKKAVGGGT